MSASNLKLIDTSKLFSKSECAEIVRNTLNQDDFTIGNVKLFGDKTVFGFLGEYFRLVTQFEDEAGNSTTETSPKPLVYFIKSLPIDDEMKRKRIESYNMFHKEWLMYSELLPKFNIENELF